MKLEQRIMQALRWPWLSRIVIVGLAAAVEIAEALGGGEDRLLAVIETYEARIAERHETIKRLRTEIGHLENLVAVKEARIQGILDEIREEEFGEGRKKG